VCLSCVVDFLTVYRGCPLRGQCGCRQANIFNAAILICLASWARCVLIVDFACPRKEAGVSNTHANSKSTAVRFCAVLADDGLLHGPRIGPSFALFASPSTGAEPHGPMLSHARLLPDAWDPCTPRLASSYTAGAEPHGPKLSLAGLLSDAENPFSPRLAQGPHI
jgi:hypothetical protein